MKKVKEKAGKPATWEASPLKRCLVPEIQFKIRSRAFFSWPPADAHRLNDNMNQLLSEQKSASSKSMLSILK